MKAMNVNVVSVYLCRGVVIYNIMESKWNTNPNTQPTPTAKNLSNLNIQLYIYVYKIIVLDWRKLLKKQHVSAFFGKSVLKCHLT